MYEEWYWCLFDNFLALLLLVGEDISWGICILLQDWENHLLHNKFDNC